MVLLGAYKLILTAVNNRDFTVISAVGAGAVFGLLVFSRVLKWLFANYKNYTLAVLTGFVIGSLNKIWPWKETLTWRVNSHGNRVPFNQQSVSPFSFLEDNQLLIAVIFAVVGFSLIILLEKISWESR